MVLSEKPLSLWVWKKMLTSVFVTASIFKFCCFMNKKKILILHDAIDLKDFKYKKKRNFIKNISYVGSFHKGKGIELILKLANEFKKIQFNIYEDPMGKIYRKSKNMANNTEKTFWHHEKPDSKQDIITITLWPYRSLDSRGFSYIMTGFIGLIFILSLLFYSLQWFLILLEKMQKKITSENILRYS